MSSLSTLRQIHIDWLIGKGVPPEAIINPTIIEVARGSRADDGIFEHGFGLDWLAIPQESDVVYWRPRENVTATEFGHAFALGEEAIRNPGVTALGGWLQIHASPLEWLRSRREGLFVLRWDWAFEQLRDLERIAVPEEMVDTYLKAMKPRLPELGVIRRQDQEIAA